MKKTLKMHQEKKTKSKDTEKVAEGAVPAYLLDREGQTRAKVLSNMIKQKRKEKAVSIGPLRNSSCFGTFFEISLCFLCVSFK